MYLRCTKKLQTVIIIIISFTNINPSMTLVFKFPDGKVKVKVKFTAEQAMKAQSGSRGIGLLFL